MNFFIQQDICIHSLRIDGLTNSSVLQIGSAGVIKPISNLYNTGGFTKPAAPLTPPGVVSQPGVAQPILVPLAAPS